MIDWLSTSFSPSAFYRDHNDGTSSSPLNQLHLDDVAIMFEKNRIVYAEVDDITVGREVVDEEQIDRPVSVRKLFRNPDSATSLFKVS